MCRLPKIDIWWVGLGYKILLCDKVHNNSITSCQTHFKWNERQCGDECVCSTLKLCHSWSLNYLTLLIKVNYIPSSTFSKNSTSSCIITICKQLCVYTKETFENFFCKEQFDNLVKLQSHNSSSSFVISVNISFNKLPICLFCGKLSP